MVHLKRITPKIVLFFFSASCIPLTVPRKVLYFLNCQLLRYTSNGSSKRISSTHPKYCINPIKCRCSNKQLMPLFQNKCYINLHELLFASLEKVPGRVAQSVGHLTRKSGVLGSIPGLATYFRFSFRFFKKGSCQLLVKVCAVSTG